MAIGDKKSVVMGFDKATPGGVATLDASGNVLFEQLGNVVHPNLLHNWYFVNPVNQRGGWVVPSGSSYYDGSGNAIGTLSEYTAISVANNSSTNDYNQIVLNGTKYYVRKIDCIRGYVNTGYTIDRWKIAKSGAGVVTVEDDAIKISTISGTYFDLRQPLDGFDASGVTVTISAIINGKLYYKSGTGTITITVTDLGNIYLTKEAGVYYVVLRPVNNRTFTVKAVKLELGSTQTLAHQDAEGNWVLNEIPDYNEELLKCCMSTADSSDTYANNKKTPAAIGAYTTKFGYIPETLSILEWAYAKGESGSFCVGPSNTDTPNTKSSYWMGKLYWQSSGRIEVECTDVTGGNGYRSFRNLCVDGVWRGWKCEATTDYAVNKAGDTMTGTSLGLGDGYGEVRIHGSAAFMRTRNVKNDDDNSRYLAVFNSTHTSDIAKAIRLTDVDAEGNEAHYYLLHTGNKPSYSYKGTGLTSLQEIPVGGIGGALIIYSDKGIAIATEKNFICISNSSSVSTASGYYKNGVLYIASGNECVNASTIDYYCQVI